MSKKTKHIFILIFICSVFSLTLQASIINFCKENKCFVKSQNQQNNIDSEEEAQDSDETVDEEDLLNVVNYLHDFMLANNNLFRLQKLNNNISSTSIEIIIPPPENKYH